MPSIREVALKAGVAPSTVSFVLNNKECVAPETKARVEEVLRDLRYVHRKGGRPIRGNIAPKGVRRKNQVAFLFPQETAALLRISTFMVAVHAIESELTRQGINLVIRHLPADLPPGPHNMSTKIDGAIFIQDERPLPIKSVIARLPAVRIFGAVNDDEPFDHVTYDIRLVARLAGEYLLKRGHKRCAYLSPHAGLSISKAKAYARLGVIHERVFRETVEAAGGTVYVNTTGVPGWLPDTPQTFAKIIAELFQKSPTPTALFIPADGLTAHAYSLMQSMGIRPGIDIDVVCCNNQEHGIAGLNPAPAVIDLHAAAIGVMAIKQLFARMDHPELPRLVTLIRPELKESTEV